METTINLLTSSSDQCLAIAFQNQMKLLSNKLKHFIDIVNPLLTPPPIIYMKTPSLLSTLLSPSPLFFTTKVKNDKLY